MPFLRSNQALLDGFRAGTPEALETVYWEYVRKVERLLTEGFVPRERSTRVMGVHRRVDELADLVQEVFLRAFSEKARRAYDGLRDFGPYLFTIARNVLADWNRVRCREVVTSGPSFTAFIESAAVIEETPAWAEPTTVRLVERYLAELPPNLRELHRLRYDEGVSQEQAAKELGVSRQTLRTLEARLRDGLAVHLEAAGIDTDGQPESSPARSGNTSMVRNATQTQ